MEANVKPSECTVDDNVAVPTERSRRNGLIDNAQMRTIVWIFTFELVIGGQRVDDHYMNKAAQKQLQPAQSSSNQFVFVLAGPHRNGTAKLIITELIRLFKRIKLCG
ncbi:unnamed protein product [Colias eurytheme]|nr:unnamed protein product [Colias eurytheme]